MELDLLILQAQLKSKEFSTYFKRLKKGEIKTLDSKMQQLHQEVFDQTDCLSCGNCCRSLGPRVTDRDIEKISCALKIRPAEVVERYLRIDEDADYVFQTMPCPFLGSDNYCSIYPHRPKACREYPHTDRKKFFQIHALTIKNGETCPAVFEILNRLTTK